MCSHDTVLSIPFLYITGQISESSSGLSTHACYYMTIMSVIDQLTSYYKATMQPPAIVTEQVLATILCAFPLQAELTAMPQTQTSTNSLIQLGLASNSIY